MTLCVRLAATNTAGQTHSYGVFYDPAPGKLQVWRDGVLLGSWTDPTPLTTGEYLSLRTDAANVLFVKSRPTAGVEQLGGAEMPQVAAVIAPGACRLSNRGKDGPRVRGQAGPRRA